MTSFPLELPLAIESALQQHRAGQLAAAEAGYCRVLTVDPENFDALHLLGVLARQTGDLDKAIALISHAVQINDNEPAAQNNLGVAYQARNQPDAAETWYRRALSLRPDYAEAHYNLGTVLVAAGRYQEAARSYRSAVACKPGYREAFNNLGATLRELGDLEEAETAFREAIRIKPDAEIYGNLGATLRTSGKPEQAELAYQQAIALDPDFSEAIHNLSQTELLLGNYAAGFDHYEQRFAVGTGKLFQETTLSRFQHCQRWRGEPLAGRSLLVITEQGSGDNLMMMRYLPLLKRQNLERLTVCNRHAPLQRLFQTISGVDAVVSLEEASQLYNWDLYCPSMSLPYLCHTRIDTIPDTTPYLAVPERITQPWRTRLAAIPGMKVGLTWAAGCYLNYTDELRSIPLTAFAPLMRISGVHMVSLQKNDAASQISELGGAMFDWMAECADFLDTAALVAALDLVISVDTAVVHLAGALGKPVWLLNRFAGDWRWLLERNDSPWYPSLRIFRQDQCGDWERVVTMLAAELSRPP